MSVESKSDASAFRRERDSGQMNRRTTSDCDCDEQTPLAEIETSAPPQMTRRMASEAQGVSEADSIYSPEELKIIRDNIIHRLATTGPCSDTDRAVDVHPDDVEIMSDGHSGTVDLVALRGQTELVCMSVLTDVFTRCVIPRSLNKITIHPETFVSAEQAIESHRKASEGSSVRSSKRKCPTTVESEDTGSLANDQSRITTTKWLGDRSAGATHTASAITENGTVSFAGSEDAERPVDQPQRKRLRTPDGANPRDVEDIVSEEFTTKTTDDKSTSKSAWDSRLRSSCKSEAGGCRL
ncbi:hypothetical protein IAT40_004931 [Kwoniella sp. CBS 6097]